MDKHNNFRHAFSVDAYAEDEKNRKGDPEPNSTSMLTLIWYGASKQVTQHFKESCTRISLNLLDNL